MNIQISDHFSFGKLIKFTLPSIAMMIVTSIYSVVDGFFVSNFAGKTPFAAINLIMPVMMILSTVGFMFGTGGTPLVSMTYGQGDKDRANRYFSLLTYTAFLIGVVLAVAGILFIRPVASLLGANESLLGNCIIYSRIIFCVLPFYILQVMFQTFFVAAEKPHLGLAVTIASGATNMLLDAILVMALPQEYKLAGAAVATSIAQVVGGIVPLVYFFRKNSSILRLGKTKFEAGIIGKACTNGVSEFMSNISMSIVGMLYNMQLMRYEGENGLAAYGVMMYVSMIFAAVFIGYTIGVAPIVGYNYGAQNHDELQGILKKSIRVIGISGIGMVIAAQILTIPLAKIFVGYDKGLFQLTVSGFRIFAIAFLFMGFGIFVSGFFTALNDGVTSAMVSFLRTFVFQCTAIMILPIFFQIKGVWISVVIAELLSFICAFAFILLKRKRYNY